MTERIDSRMKVIRLKVCSGQTDNTGRRKYLVNWEQRAARRAGSFLPICYFHDVKSGDMKYPNFLS